VSSAPVYRWIAASLGVGIGASALLLLILMLRLLLGPFEVLAEDGAARQLRVGLWEPASHEAESEWLRAARRERWRALLPPGAELNHAARLDTLSAWASVVAVADAAALGDAESAELATWIEGGGSALLAGWVGKGGEAMQRLLGVEQLHSLPADASLFVAAGARGPLSSGLLPGQRVDLGAAVPSPAIDAPAGEIFWSDWALRARAPGAGAALRARRGKGRLVWLGFGPERAPASAESLALLQRVYANALAWATGEPAVELLAWPGGAPLAGLLAMDTEDRFANALPVAQRARADGFPITFMVLTSLAPAHAALLPELGAAGEIGSHADVHDGLRDVPVAEQRRRIERSRAQLAALGVAELRGFRAPYESYDAETLRLLGQLGFEYLLGDAAVQGMAPRLVPIDGTASLVQVPRIPQDDHDLLIRRALHDPDEFRRALLGEVELSLRSGGLHYFSFHTQHFGERARVDALADLARELRARGAWLCTGGELARWWQQRAQVDLALRRSGPQRVQLSLTNRGLQPQRELAVRIHPNHEIAEARASATVVFRAEPVLRRSAEYVDVLLPELPAGASREYAIDLLPAARLPASAAQ
jgi:peptidoglycan/xylan/chitin deacetylase (PgdA/CDA1 family)